jgi:hypothetical protein
MKASIVLVLLVVAAAGTGLVLAAELKNTEGFKDTPMLPGGKWHVHDPDRPQAPVVDPGPAAEKPLPPPADAVILFDGKDLSKWKGKDGPAQWAVKDGAAITNGTGEIRTAQDFGDFQLHIEWSTPTPPKGNGQDRGNSGVFLFGRYEIQVLDCYHNVTYADGSAGAVYGQTPPLVNACRPPGEWQTYDILFTAPHFKDGAVETPAYVTVLQNGIVVQNHTQILGATGHKISPKYTPHGAKGPIMLQDHGNPVRFRNIWIRELKESGA